MDDSLIRQYSINGHTKAIKKLLLSDKGREIYLFVSEKREATSADVADKFDISTQNACMKLNKLYRQSYLRRDEVKQESGGYEWNYYP